MKTAFALLVIFNIVVALAVAAFFFRYSIVETASGGEYVAVLSEQAHECDTGGGCAVFSQREFLKYMAAMMRGRM